MSKSQEHQDYKDSVSHFVATGKFTSPVVKGKRAKALHDSILKGESKSKGKSHYSGKKYNH